MQRLIPFFLIVLFFSSPVLDAQEPGKEDAGIRTLFSTPVSNGGYGALSMGYARIGGSGAFVSGLKGGWLVNHRLTLGLAGYGFINNLSYSSSTTETALTGGYGGLLLEPVFWYRSPVHLTVPLIIGAGGITYLDHSTLWLPEDYPVAAYFCFVPGMEIEINVVKFMRIAIGGDYRFTPDIDLRDRFGNEVAPHDVMRGFTGHVVFKFGKF